MATKIARCEVWIVDLGMVAKIRPCLVLSIPSDDENDRVLTTLNSPYDEHSQIAIRNHHSNAVLERRSL